MDKLTLCNKIQIAMDNSPYNDKKFVIGDGSIDSKVMLVGEAPGANEEKEGKPFVGKAGKMLTDFLNGIEIDRKELYISNVVKIRPSKINPASGKLNNRKPNKEEVEFFLPFLLEEIDMVSPKVIVTLGNFALCAITGNKKATIGEFHGEPLEVQNDIFGSKMVFPLYHPASLIYNKHLQPTYNEDLAKLKTFLSAN